MSAVPIADWRLPGCDDRCWLGAHDPSAHEAHGRRLEREARRLAVVRTGPLVVDLLTRTATLDGRELEMPRREWDLLACLARQPGAWIDNDEIRLVIWGPMGVEATSRNIVTAGRNRLRARLGTAGHLIETNPFWRSGAPRTRLRLEPPTEATP